MKIADTPETPPPSRRGLRTRSALLAAGRTLFAEHPADAVAIDDLVNEAKVAKGSFYNHFPDKDSLLDAIVTDIRKGIEARIQVINADVVDPAARIARAVCVYAASVRHVPSDGHILLRNDQRSSPDRSLNDGLLKDLSDGLHSSRLVLPSVDAGLLFVIGITHSLLLSAVRRRTSAQARTEAQQLCMLMLRGFGLSHSEADLISAQATDAILRKDIFTEQ